MTYRIETKDAPIEVSRMRISIGGTTYMLEEVEGELKIMKISIDQLDESIRITPSVSNVITLK